VPSSPLLLDHTLAVLNRLDLLIQREVRLVRATRGQRTDEQYRGLYVSEDDVDGLIAPTLSGPAGPPAEDVFQAALHAADQHIEEITARCRERGEEPRLERLGSVFGLTRFEQDVVMIALAAEVDLKYERLYAYLQDDVTRKRPTVDLVFRLAGLGARERLAARRSFDADGALQSWELVGLYDDPAARRPVLLSRFLKLDERIVGYLLGSDSIDAHLAPLRAVPAPDDVTGLSPRVQEQLNQWSAGWRWHQPATPPVILVHGRYGAGHRSAASALAAAFGRPLLLLEASALSTAEVSLARRIMLAQREAMLTDAVLCWEPVDALLHTEPGQEADYRAFTRSLAAGQVPVVLLAERAWEPGRALQQRPFLRLELADPSYAERRDLWAHRLNGSSHHLESNDISDLAARFRLSHGQIRDAVTRAHTLAWARDPSTARMSADDLDAACRAQAHHRLGTLARKLLPRYGWDDIVLPAPQLTTLRLVAAMIRQRPTVYGAWGFDRKLAMGKGVITLFAGPSGTGKTMAAEILARDLGLDLYRIDLSSVVNKYIGETEKNLERLFSEAQDSDAILFFDEADALFGKRSGVSDAHDRYANIETAYLLQRTEQYNGLVILASNLPRNMDDAFVRRVHYTINFAVPEEEERLEIWRRTFPTEAPRADDLDLEFLARRLKITGGNIRNIILAAAFLAAEDNVPIGMRHLVRATGYELQKMGRMLVESDFGKYFEFLRA
jgi:hypothetical protein